MDSAATHKHKDTPQTEDTVTWAGIAKVEYAKAMFVRIVQEKSMMAAMILLLARADTATTPGGYAVAGSLEKYADLMRIASAEYARENIIILCVQIVSENSANSAWSMSSARADTATDTLRNALREKLEWMDAGITRIVQVENAKTGFVRMN
jgi:hypothetical protein